MHASKVTVHAEISNGARSNNDRTKIDKEKVVFQ